MSRFARKQRPPPGFEILEPTLDSLENEIREMYRSPSIEEKMGNVLVSELNVSHCGRTDIDIVLHPPEEPREVNEQHEGKRKNEAQWPVFQINWQRSRYVYDMHYVYKAITKDVIEYCIRNKLVDGPLMAKWKKPGYERLCSTYVINTKNYKFGTVSICRVPKQYLAPGTVVEDVTTGCRGCATGAGGNKNIFGNKYGQYLAAIQMARKKKREQREREELVAADDQDEDDDDEEDDDGGGRGSSKGKTRHRKGGADSDSEDDKDAGVWADNEGEAMMGPDFEGKANAEAERDARKAAVRMGGSDGPRPDKKART